MVFLRDVVHFEVSCDFNVIVAFCYSNSQELTLNLFDPVCLLIRFNKRWSRLVVFHACHDYQLLLEN